MAQLGAAVAAITAILITIFITKHSVNKRHVKKLQDAGVPMPDFHPIFGHMPAFKEALSVLPRGVTTHTMTKQLSKKISGGIFYLNPWPFSKTLVVVTDPHLAAQIERANYDKPAGIRETMEIINGGPSLMTMRGGVWKTWRSLFNPGFASGYMTGLAPGIADEVAVFCDILGQHAANKDLFQLEELTMRLTFDIIGRVTLGSRLHYQTQDSVLADGIRTQIVWTPYATTLNPFKLLSIRPLVQKYTSWRINQYLSSEIDKRFDELALSRRDQGQDASAKAQSRSIISLAMDQFLAENSENLSKETFKKMAIPQIRMFLYAGHDTTSSTLLYCYYMLSKNPTVLAKLRAEHDDVLGSDFSAQHCKQVINENPPILNQLPYTQAVIKEVLRVFPPAGSIRDGRPDFVLIDKDGRKYPTQDCQIWTLPLVMHHNPNLFDRPTELVPERWLVGPEDPLHPQKGSWRPFEWGPRACIGQTLAMLELKVALAMTVRVFDVLPAYDEWDVLHPKPGIQVVDGDRAYQAEMGGGGAHPVDGFPVRVSLRK